MNDCKHKYAAHTEDGKLFKCIYCESLKTGFEMAETLHKRIAEAEAVHDELVGLANMVNDIWGSEAPSMNKVIVRAKALLEASSFNLPHLAKLDTEYTRFRDATQRSMAEDAQRIKELEEWIRMMPNVGTTVGGDGMKHLHDILDTQSEGE